MSLFSKHLGFHIHLRDMERCTLLIPMPVKYMQWIAKCIECLNNQCISSAITEKVGILVEQQSMCTGITNGKHSEIGIAY
jgi:hypothetical protein